MTAPLTLSRDSQAAQRINVVSRLGDGSFWRSSVGQPAQTCLAGLPGWLGRKAQRGFYDYRGAKPVPTR